MPRVLLVDPDVESLGEVASALRSRGFAVANAIDAYEAVEAAYRSAPDAVLVVSSLDQEGELTQALRLIPQLQHLPVLSMPERRDAGGRRVAGMPQGELEVVVTRILEAVPRPAMQSDPGVSDELRGNLSQMGLADLLQMLAMNKRSGTVTVTLPGGTGEIRVDEGEIADASYRRLEGEKALFRLLRESSGHFAFNPQRASGPRRIQGPGYALLMDGMRHADEVREMRRKLKADGVAFIAPKGVVDDPPASGGPVSGSGEIPSGALLDDVLRRLRAPRTIDELLDDVLASDLAILEAVALLEGGGRVRRVALGDLAARIAPEGGIAALRPLVARLAHPAFAMPRMVVATPPRKLSLLAATLQRLVEVSVAAEAPPRIDVARRLGVIRLGDGVEIELVGLPAHDALAPTWPLALSGAFVVVRLGQAGGGVLEAHCETLEVKLLEADTLVGPVEPTEPERLAILLRRALEVTAGV
jgi:CheY-like chemotaxis protein